MNSEIHSTTDYSFFKSLPFNRGTKSINKSHLSKLQDSIKDRNLLPFRPIIINKDYVIIDGHHRLEAAKNLNLPVYYVIAEDCTYEDSMLLTRGTTDWSSLGYIQCRASNNEPEFVKLKDFLDKYNIVPHILFRLLGRSGKRKRFVPQIKDGSFAMTNEIYQLAPYLEKIHQIIVWMLSAGYFGKKKQITSEFWYGCYKVLSYKRTRVDYLMLLLQERLYAVSKELSSWKSVAKSLVKIHNHDLKENSKILESAVLDDNVLSYG